VVASLAVHLGAVVRLEDLLAAFVHLEDHQEAFVHLEDHLAASDPYRNSLAQAAVHIKVEVHLDHLLQLVGEFLYEGSMHPVLEKIRGMERIQYFFP